MFCRDIERLVVDMEVRDQTQQQPDTTTLSHDTENAKQEDDDDDDREINVKIADLGNSCWIDHHFTMDIQTRQYRSPEVILGQKYTTKADIWSFGCLVFELLVGDFLFDPKAGERYGKDDDHVAQIVELMGGVPRKMSGFGKYAGEIFNRKGWVCFIVCGVCVCIVCIDVFMYV